MPCAVGRMYTKAGHSYDHGTALAADLKIRPSSDETARVSRPTCVAVCCFSWHRRCGAADLKVRPPSDGAARLGVLFLHGKLELRML